MAFISGGLGLLLSIIGLLAGFLAMKQKPGAKLIALGFAANLVVKILHTLGIIFLYKIPLVGTIIIPILMNLLELVFYLGMVFGVVLLCADKGFSELGAALKNLFEGAKNMAANPSAAAADMKGAAADVGNAANAGAMQAGNAVGAQAQVTANAVDQAVHQPGQPYQQPYQQPDQQAYGQQPAAAPAQQPAAAPAQPPAAAPVQQPAAAPDAAQPDQQYGQQAYGQQQQYGQQEQAQQAAYQHPQPHFPADEFQKTVQGAPAFPPQDPNKK